MGFVFAIDALMSGMSVCRRGWSKQNARLCLLPSSPHHPEPWIALRWTTKNGREKIAPWNVRHADLLADDWGEAALE